MASLIPKLIAFGLGAAVSPIAITLLITVMFRAHARRNSLLFLLGYTLTLVAIGMAAVFIFHGAGSGGTSKLDGYIDLALSIICFALIPRVLRRKAKPAKETIEQDMKASRAFRRGIVAMLVNPSTMVVYIAGVHAISAAKLSAGEDVLAMAILTLVTLVTLLIPIGLYFVYPQRSQQALRSMRTWLSNHMKEIGVAVLVIFGIFLLVKSITALA